jgi:hypothetical protein
MSEALPLLLFISAAIFALKKTCLRKEHIQINNKATDFTKFSFIN